MQETTKGSSSSSSSRLTKVYKPGKVGKTLIDPDTKDNYLLNKEIGSASNGSCRVFQALFSEYNEETATLVPSGQVTLKTINKYHEDEVMDLEMQALIRFQSRGKLIEVLKYFTTAEMYCVSFPYMSHGSLRYILSTRPRKQLPEDCIGIVLGEALHGLLDIHVKERSHGTFNAGDIFVHVNDTDEILIKLALNASVYDSENINVEENEDEPNVDEEIGGSSSDTTSFLSLMSISKWGSAPEMFEGKDVGADLAKKQKADIWLFGVTALELGYGELLQVRNREEFIGLIKKIRDTKKLPKIEKLLERKRSFKKATVDLFKGKTKLLSGKKKEERVFSEEFEKLVIACLCEKPDKRPTVQQLLEFPFFKIQRDKKRFEQFLLNAEDPNPPTDN